MPYRPELFDRYTKRIRNLAEKEIIGMIPLKRLGGPEEVAVAVRFLASKESWLYHRRGFARDGRIRPLIGQT